MLANVARNFPCIMLNYFHEAKVQGAQRPAVSQGQCGCLQVTAGEFHAGNTACQKCQKGCRYICVLNVGYAWLPLRCLFWDLEGDVSRVWRSLWYLRHSIPGRRFTWSKPKFTRLVHPVIGFTILCAHVSLHMNWPVHGIIVNMWVLISDVWLWNVTNPPPKMTDKTQIWKSHWKYQTNWRYWSRLCPHFHSNTLSCTWTIHTNIVVQGEVLCSVYGFIFIHSWKIEAFRLVHDSAHPELNISTQEVLSW